MTMPTPCVVGILARQLWSVGGPADRSNVSQLLSQPFVNYNLSDGVVSGQRAGYHCGLESKSEQPLDGSGRWRCWQQAKSSVFQEKPTSTGRA
jgi:hypothetical protein